MNILFNMVTMTSLLMGIAWADKEVAKQLIQSEWIKTNPSLQNPESVYFDPSSKSLFISNVAGQPTVKDGKGWIDQYDLNGELKKHNWVNGLNAPKGMRIVGENLWVSDIDEVISINARSGKIVRKIAIPGAQFLNDIVGDIAGNVYVSDTIGNKIYRIDNVGKVFTFVEGVDLEGPNGLIVYDGKLYVSSWGTEIKKDWSVTQPGKIYSIDLDTKDRKDISGPLGNLDGLEITKSNDLIVSDWMVGKVFKVTMEGEVTLIYQSETGAADIGLIPDAELLIVPQMNKNNLTALKLK